MIINIRSLYEKNIIVTNWYIYKSQQDLWNKPIKYV